MDTVLGSEMTTKLAAIRYELNLKCGKVESLIAEIDKVLGNGSEETQTPTSIPGSPFQAAVEPGRTHSKRDSIIQQALRQLQRGPYGTRDLLNALAQEGYPIKGKRPIQTLYGILHKDMKSAKPRVKRSKDGLWQEIRNN